ncbi:MAG TPA: MauE/DoxX family redox-associated membrane protein [Actinomycetota bacterium]|nr:MauE/DoxX family redox-associated membrane protein [Actinomycetota bacterium]
MTPDVLAPVFFLAAGLLVLAGATKILRPDPTAQALLDAGLPGSLGAARGVGVVEIAVGVWACAAPAAGGAVALGALYVLFAGYLGFLLVARPDAGSCGCAGPTPVPPSRLHLALNVVATAAGFAYALTHAPTLGAWVASLGWAAVPIVLGLLVAGWLAVVAVTAAPAAFRSWTPGDHDHEHTSHGHDHGSTDRELAHAGIAPGHASLWPSTKPEDA